MTQSPDMERIKWAQIHEDYSNLADHYRHLSEQARRKAAIAHLIANAPAEETENG